MASVLKEGIAMRLTTVVSESCISKRLERGGFACLATPAMYAFVEDTCFKLVSPFLKEGDTMVGSSVCIRYFNTPLKDAPIHCIAMLKSIRDDRLIFDTVCYDETGEIGEGQYEGIIVNTKGFMIKCIKRGETIDDAQ